jgi:hypothetical protein
MFRSKKNRSKASPPGQQDGAYLSGQADPGTDTGSQPVTATGQDQGALPGQHDIFSIPEAIEITDKMRSQLASDSGSNPPSLAQLPPKRDEPETLEEPDSEPGKPLDVSRIVSSIEYNSGMTHTPPLSGGRKISGGQEPARGKFREGQLSRLVERGVVHPLPVRLVISAILLLLTKFFLASLIIIFCVLMFTGNAKLVTGLLPFVFAFIPCALGFFIVANRSRCRICSCPLFFIRPCRKHRAAHYVPLVGIACSTAFHLLIFKWMRCMYCGTAIRLRHRAPVESSRQEPVAGDDQY